MPDYSYLLGQKGEIWYDKTDIIRMYNEIPQLYNAINKKAIMCSNVVFKKVDLKTKNIVEDFELQKLLENPNPLQKQNKFIEEFIILYSLFGEQFMYKNKPSRSQSYPSTLKNISNNYIAPYFTGKYLDATKIEEIISHYVYKGKGFEETIATEKILYTSSTNIENPVSGRSPLMSLLLPISNIKCSYTYRNVIMSKKGGVGMLSPEKNKDGVGAIPFEPEDKKNIEKDFTDRRGIFDDQSTMIITEKAMKYTPFGYPTKEMMLFEEVEKDALEIYDAYGLNAHIFSNSNTKYDDLVQSLVQTQQDTIQPEMDSFAQSLTTFILKPEDQLKYKIIATFDHLPIITNYRKKGIEGFKLMSESIDKLVERQLLDKPMASAIIKNEINSIYGQI